MLLRGRRNWKELTKFLTISTDSELKFMAWKIYNKILKEKISYLEGTIAQNKKSEKIRIEKEKEKEKIWIF